MALAVAVSVAAPVSVAALVSGNDIVDVFDAARFDSCVLVHGVDHGPGIVPAHERGHAHGRGHVHAHGHVAGFDRPF